jgi:lambda family phage portal protein
VRILGYDITRNTPTAPRRQIPGATTIRRDYDAGTTDRLLADWRLAVGYSPTILATQYPIMVARSREQFKNNPYAKKIVALYRQNVIGATGMLFRPTPTDPGGKIDTGAAADLWAGFDEWSRDPAYVDAGGRLTFRAFCEAVCIGLIRDGNVFIRLLPGFDYPRNPFGFSLQILPATGLDTAYNVDDGRVRIYNGVQVDQWRRPVAYHFRKPDANSRLNPSPCAYVAGEHETFIAAEILHVYDRAEDSEACIGVPWLYSVLTRLKTLGDYEFAELVAAKKDANHNGDYEVSPGTDFTAENAGESYEAARGSVIGSAPGEDLLLPPGVKYNAHMPTRPNTAANDFRKGMLQGVASGTGVQYNGLANDLEGVNFSSIRSGKFDERDAYMLVQQLIIEQAASPIYARGWVPAFLLSGKSFLPASKLAKFASHQFRGRRWPWVDPQSDAQYNEICRAHGWKTDDTIAGEIGEDFEANAEAIKVTAPMVKGTYLEQGYAQQQQPKPAGSGKPTT